MLKHLWSLRLLGFAVFTALLTASSSAIATEAGRHSTLELSNSGKAPSHFSENLLLAKVPQDRSLGQVTSVNQLSDVQPTDWAYQALQSLVERYGCIVGYPDSTFRGSRALTRYEFAAGLNACLDRINELIAAETSNLASKEDLASLQRLQEEFAAELATLRGRVDSLEARTAQLEANQFSTTTKLRGEVIFGLTDAFTNEDGGTEDNTVLQDRVRLEFNTSFTGSDRLVTRLAAGNATPFGGVGDGATSTSFQTFNIGDTGNNDVVLDWTAYYFPIGENIKAYVAGAGGIHSDYVPTINPYLGDQDGGNGSLSTFGQESPIYRIGGGAGLALNYKFSDSLALTVGYLADQASDPGDDTGFFNGDNAALSQITFTPNDKFQVGLTYVHGYHNSGNSIFDLGNNSRGVVGTFEANQPHSGGVSGIDTRPATSNSYGIETSFKFSPRIVLNGFFGYTDVALTGKGSGEIWYYGLGFAFPDLIKQGSLAGIMVGAQPYLGGYNDGDLSSVTNQIPLHIEGFYRFQVNDHISITPGLIYLQAPSQDTDSDDDLIGTVRTTFTF